MNHTPGTAADGGGFDPGQAAALLEQTTRQARRQLEPSPPWLLAIRGAAVLAVLGAVWFSVRGQHPYRHPTAAVIPVVIAFGILNLAATLAVRKRATTGVSGRSPLRPAEIAVAVVACVAPFAVMGALIGARVSDAVVYGWYPVAVPLIVAGLAWAAIMAARANWRACGTAAAVVVVGTAAAAAGPAGAWAVAGVGLCLTLFGTAAVIAWQQRAGRGTP